MLSLPTDELLDRFARGTSVPGAGPAAAFVTAFAAALAAMAARSSLESWADARAAVAQAESLRARAGRLAQEDAEALEAFLAVRHADAGAPSRSSRLQPRTGAGPRRRRPARDRGGRVRRRATRGARRRSLRGRRSRRRGRGRGARRRRCARGRASRRGQPLDGRRGRARAERAQSRPPGRRTLRTWLFQASVIRSSRLT